MSYRVDNVKIMDGRTNGQTDRWTDIGNDNTPSAWKAIGLNLIIIVFETRIMILHWYKSDIQENFRFMLRCICRCYVKGPYCVDLSSYTGLHQICIYMYIWWNQTFSWTLPISCSAGSMKCGCPYFIFKHEIYKSLWEISSLFSLIAMRYKCPCLVLILSMNLSVTYCLHVNQPVNISADVFLSNCHKTKCYCCPFKPPWNRAVSVFWHEI